MTIINLTETTRLKVDTRQYCPEYYDAGGELVRMPTTGEMVEKTPKWVSTGTFHSTIESAIQHLARVDALKTEEYNSLKEYLDKVISLEDNMLKCLKGK